MFFQILLNRKDRRGDKSKIHETITNELMSWLWFVCFWIQVQALEK
jgi:hypothetical protein